MAAEIIGYTIAVGTEEEPSAHVLTVGYAGPGFEPVYWDMADLLVAELESRYPSLTFISSVTRQERESVAVSRPS